MVVPYQPRWAEEFERTAARIDGYLLLKDPVFHILYAAASLWAEKVGWRPGDDHR